MSSEVGLVLSALSVDYGSFRAVDTVDLEIGVGEVMALLGPSGCGKSSLLRAVAGLVPVGSGSVRWRGLDLGPVATHRRDIGLMFQHHALFPHRNVAENVAFGLKIRGVGAKERRARATQLLEQLGLSGFEDRTVGTLSGGQAQRVALARALAPGPSLLLLDEPLAALDRGLRDRLAVDLRALLVATGTTAVYVTHDHDEAATVADRLAVMDLGRILAVGRIDDLRADPRTEAVAAALALETVWSAPVSEGRISTPWGPGPSVAETLEAKVLLAPTHVTITSSAGVAGRVVARVRKGDGWHVRCELEGAGEPAAVTCAAPHEVPEGRNVRVAADLSGLVVLSG